MPEQIVAIGADHAGFPLKARLAEEIPGFGWAVLDCGTDSDRSVDYPDFAAAVVRALRAGEARMGVLVCGTGIGMTMAANRHPGIRAALCGDATAARLARQHNDANVLALGARMIGSEVAADCLRAFLETGFEGGDRHLRRIEKMG